MPLDDSRGPASAIYTVKKVMTINGVVEVLESAVSVM